MRFRIAVCRIFIAALVFAGVVTVAKAQKVSRFPNAGVKIVQPQGFTVAKSFDGFEQASTGSSVVVLRIPGPFAEVTRGFTAEGLKSKGMSLQSKQEVTIDGKPGLLLNLTQSAHRATFRKWIVALGDPSQTILVTASFPQERTAQLSEKLKKAVLSVRQEMSLKPQAGEGLPFTITPSTKLKPATNIGKMLLYTKDGSVPAKSPTDPLFVVAPSMGKTVITDQREFSRKRMEGMAQTSDISITSHQPIQVNGLAGFETLATGTDTKSGTPLSVYQTMLFDGDSYIVMQGLVGNEQNAVYLPEFKAMARSLRLKS
jgi:hypothetical protein